MTQLDYEAIVVGAGFGGLRMLHELRELGVSACVLEAGADVGGTWYWNRYPGARTDSEAFVYAMSFSHELLQEWDWSVRYPAQEEVQRYLAYVADRFDMRRDIRFDTRVVAASYDEAANAWTVSTQAGDCFVCRYLISATGLLSVAYVPDFPGLDRFKGEWYLTARWPNEGVDVSGKRVVVIGTGASGVQLIPQIALLAEHVTVLQRTPNYVIPARNAPIDQAERIAVKREYDAVWARARAHFFGFDMGTAGVVAAELTPAEQRRALEAGWEKGGFRFVFETFDDMTTDPATNELACAFIREKIRAIVRDRKTAELLCPTYPLAAKRPPLGHGYYEAFNRENVTLMNVASDPIQEITERGVRTACAVHDCDVVIFATGFDAFTGALTSIDVRGRDGTSIKEKWRYGPRTFLGIGIDGFPNLFMISGPQSSFANIPVVVDYTSRWIGRALTAMRTAGEDRIEATPEAVGEWCDMLDALMRRPTILAQGEQVGSWFVGANVPGKAHTPLFHLAGLSAYIKDCERVAAERFAGFARSASPTLAR
jgi:cyclohexanone monooxygenase